MTRFVPFRSPLEGLAILKNRLNSIFSDFEDSKGEMQSESISASSFVPPVDIYEDADRLLRRLEVAGISLEILQITIRP